MPKIELTTNIIASKEIVFDLSRSVDLHEISTQHTKEKAIAGGYFRTDGIKRIGDMEGQTLWRVSKIDFTDYGT